MIIQHLQNPLIRSIPIFQFWQEQWLFGVSVKRGIRSNVLQTLEHLCIGKCDVHVITLWPETEFLNCCMLEIVDISGQKQTAQHTSNIYTKPFFLKVWMVQKREFSFSQFSLSLFLQGRVLVCADGATSKLATQLGLVKQPPQGSCSRAYVEGGTHNFKADGVVFYHKQLLPGRSIQLIII